MAGKRKSNRKGRSPQLGETSVKVSRETTACLQNNDGSLDEMKHSRAMSIMYHLQQRQEQVEFDLGVSTSASIDQMADEVSAIGDALQRLNRVFKITKDELNSSQCFPQIEDAAIKRKQLLLNTQITKCESLSKVQQRLEQALRDKQEWLTTHGNESMSTVGYPELGDEVFRESSSGPVSQQPDRARPETERVPFSQPCYSQPHSQAQRLLDDILGGEHGSPSSNNHHRSTCWSPPRKELTQLESWSSPLLAFEAMDASMAFEPSQGIGNQLSSVLSPQGEADNQATRCQMEYHNHVKPGQVFTPPSSSNSMAVACYGKFTVLPHVQVRILSDEDLVDRWDKILPSNIWDEPGFSHFSLPQEMIDIIDQWD